MLQFKCTKKRGQVTSSTFLRYWGKPCNLKRVNAHAEQRELLLQSLLHSVNFADFQKQESKSGYSSYMSYYSYIFLQPIGIRF